jgi:hypothetical protein
MCVGHIESDNLAFSFYYKLLLQLNYGIHCTNDFSASL